MIYQRLTVRTCARYAAVISPVVTLISGLIFFSRLLGDAASGAIPSFILGQLFLLTLIKYAPQLLILSVFTGVFIAMRRAFDQHEMDAWFSSGLGLHHFIRPVLLFALPAAFFVAIFSLYISPWAVHNINNTRAAAAFNINIDSLPQGQFGTAPRKTHSYFLDEHNTLFIANNKKDEVIFANGFHRENDTTLHLIDGSIFHFATAENGDENGGKQTLDQMRFGSIRLSLPTVDAAGVRPRAKTLSALNWNNNSERAELTWRLALPLAVIVLVLVALFLSPTHSRLNKRFGFLSVIAVFFFYLNGLRLMRDQVAQDIVPGSIALLLPPFLLGVLIFLLYWQHKR